MIASVRGSRFARAAVFAAVWILTASYIATLIDRGWGPPDEGLLAQSAERFLRGELPHRDFDDLYSGGLTVMHGVAMSAFGVKLTSLRLMLLGAVILWIPFVYLIAQRFVSPLVAAVVTCLAVVWSVPAYPASMPSWYNLFLATMALWAVLRFFETSRWRWAFAAGVCGGLSIIFKITGVYLVGAICLSVVAHAYLTGPLVPKRDTPVERRLAVPPSAMGLALSIAATLALLTLLAPRASVGTWLLLFASPALACAVLGALAWRYQGSIRPVIVRPLLAVALGVIAGVAPLVVWYAGKGAIGDLVHGVFVLPMARLEFAALAPNAASLAFASLLAYVLTSDMRARAGAKPTVLTAIIMVAGFSMLWFGDRDGGAGGVGGGNAAYAAMVGSLSAMLPFIAAYLAWLVMADRAPAVPRARLAATFAVVAVAAFSSLVAFPYANDLYFHYTVPLLMLAGAAVATAGGLQINLPLASGLTALYLVFALVHVAVNTTAPLTVERGGLRVSPSDSIEVERFVTLMRTHGRNGYTYATPDAPEAYFLTGLRNPTRTMYEFFNVDANRTAQILRTLDEHEITVVAINNWALFSQRPDPVLLEALEQRYPHSLRAWHFTVRWSETP